MDRSLLTGNVAMRCGMGCMGYTRKGLDSACRKISWCYTILVLDGHAAPISDNFGLGLCMPCLAGCPVENPNRTHLKHHAIKMPCLDRSRAHLSRE